MSTLLRQYLLNFLQYFWRVNKNRVLESAPFLISRFWYGLPDNITHVDAVYERPHDLRIIFFIGK